MSGWMSGSVDGGAGSWFKMKREMFGITSPYKAGVNSEDADENNYFPLLYSSDHASEGR